VQVAKRELGPGIYKRLPYGLYEGIPATNSSSLRELLRSPKQYLYRKENRKESEALTLGLAAHTAILEPHRFLAEYALWDERSDNGNVRPRRGKDWDAFQAAQGAQGRRIVRADEYYLAAAMRDAVGQDVDVMVDCHSFFDVALAERVAKRLEPLKLAWYEEPVAPERIEETREIRRRIQQPMAAGEILYGVAGFAPLSRNRTVNVIMPDVKHCGGLLELTRVAAAAAQDGVEVAPHNPSGPVSTAASAQVCAVIDNFKLLELQWGEVGWRGEVVVPPERFDRGTLQVSTRPGLGIELNDRVIRTKPSA